MPERNDDLHGFVPDKAAVVLLLIDVINDFEFEEAELLLGNALPIAPRIAALKQRAQAAGIPVVYVNDNFGRWQSDFNKVVAHSTSEHVRGRPFSEQFCPDDDDYFVLKPKHSGFFSTTLETLLRYLHARTLIITGIAGNNCVLFTANDAYMRDYYIVVPSDCIASKTEAENEYALDQMRKLLKAETTPSDELDLDLLVRSGVPESRP